MTTEIGAAGRTRSVVEERSAGQALEARIAFIVLATVASAVWWYNTVNLEPRLALSGFSPTYFVAERLHPEWFAAGFPSGAEEFVRSAPMLIYLLADRAGIPILATMRAMIGLEIVLLVAATAWAVRIVRPTVQWPGVWVVCLFMIAGRLLEGDFGRWGHPYYAWAYNYAYAGVIVGVAAALNRRLLLAAMALGTAVSAHVILGLLGTAFAATCVLADLRAYSWRQLSSAAALFAIIGGGWLGFILFTSDVTSAGIPNELFVAVMRMMSFHWYPVEMGLFWERHWERLYPFIAVYLLLAVHLPNCAGALRDADLRAACGFGAMLVLTVIGVLVAQFLPQPFLIKLALSRGSSVFLILAALYVVAGTWQDVRKGWHFRAAVGILVLVTPFHLSAGVPLALALAIALETSITDLRHCGITHRVLLLTAGIVVAIALATWFWMGGVALSWRASAYTGIDSFTSAERWALLAFIAGVLFVRQYSRHGAIAMLAVLAWLGTHWAATTDEMRDPAVRAKAVDYLAAQTWAHDHTPPGTLFMPDPAHYYGWREFSLRPSFGNLREWLHSAWAYNSSLKVFSEGVCRARALGVDIDTFLAANPARPLDNYSEMTRIVRARYYGLKKDDFAELHRRFEIAYFVFAKEFLSSPPPLAVVYQNAHYLIGRLPDE